MNPLKTAALSLSLVFLAACGNQVVEFEIDGGTNPVVDAGRDAGHDAGTNPGMDAGMDAGMDGGQEVAPTVTAVLPVDLATGVAVNSPVTATFSKDMDPATIVAPAFTLRQGANVIGGVVSYVQATRTATFTPSAPLPGNQTFTATVTTAARDLGGRPLNANVTWSFTTAAVMTPPRVLSNTPLNLATYVSINNRPTAVFSKAMNPATITAQTFTVQKGMVAVPGTVSLDAATNTVTFRPTAPLEVNTTYTATITTGARDTMGLALAMDYVWRFTTAACSQAPINLASAAAFVVLAGSTVTNTGPTSVTGDLGVSPGTAVTGFGPGMVVGTQHVNNPIAAQAQADLTVAYNDAAGRTLCPVSVAGNIGGQTLPPGLYKSTSSLAISSGDLTLDAQGDGDAVWIFQSASTLTTTAGRQVILAGGAKSANIFWQVGSSATLGTTSSFQGTIMADQAITLNTGATLNGRALTRVAAIALDSNTIVKPAP